MNDVIHLILLTLQGLYIEPFKRTIGDVYGSPGNPRPFKTQQKNDFLTPWLGEALGTILTSIVSNFHLGKWPGARDMFVLDPMLAPMLAKM